MPEEQEKFAFVVGRMLDVVMFEQWLRFYFISEMRDEADPEGAEPHLFLILPEKAHQKIEELYPEFLPIADFMNNKELSFTLSQQTVCTYIVEHIDGKIIPQDTAPSIMNSRAFQVQLQLFTTWMQLHEDQLEQSFFPFDKWQELFSLWKDSSAGKELEQNLVHAQEAEQHKDSQAPGTRTVQ